MKKVMFSLIILFAMSGSNVLASTSTSLLSESNKLLKGGENRNTRVGNDTKQVNYFYEKIEKSGINLLAPENEELYNNYINLNLKQEPMNTSRNRATKTWRYGDILIYKSGSKNASQEKSLTGHTAVLSTMSKYVIEAAKMKKGTKVFHWNVSNVWKGCSGIVQYKVTSKVGKNATVAKRKAAVSYGKKQIGEVYKLKTSLLNESSWYCSKLTHKMWDKQGYDLRGVKGTTVMGLAGVTPNDIAIDLNTRVVKNWGTKLPAPY